MKTYQTEMCHNEILLDKDETIMKTVKPDKKVERICQLVCPIVVCGILAVVDIYFAASMSTIFADWIKSATQIHILFIVWLLICIRCCFQQSLKKMWIFTDKKVFISEINENIQYKDICDIRVKYKRHDGLRYLFDARTILLETNDRNYELKTVADAHIVCDELIQLVNIYTR